MSRPLRTILACVSLFITFVAGVLLSPLCYRWCPLVDKVQGWPLFNAFFTDGFMLLGLPLTILGGLVCWVRRVGLFLLCSRCMSWV